MNRISQNKVIFDKKINSHFAHLSVLGYDYIIRF